MMMLQFAKEVQNGKIRRRRPAMVRDVECDVFGYDCVVCCNPNKLSYEIYNGEISSLTVSDGNE
jgi:hypothetical protein